MSKFNGKSFILSENPVSAVSALCTLRIFGKSIPETPAQLDAVDEPDADGAQQGLAVYGWRRVRRVRRV